MNTETNSKIYEKLPLIYEYLMRKIEYEVWAKYINTLVSNYVKKNVKVLELASGNCKLAKNFKQYYPKIIATDISPNMLKSSGQNNILKVCCEMTRLPFKNSFGLIYSAFDSINYLTSKRNF